MTQSLLAFNELAPGAQIGIQTSDRGVISGTAVAGGSSASSSPLAPQPTGLQGLSIIVDPANATGVATATGTSTATVDGSTGRVFNSWANLVAAWGTASPMFDTTTEIVFASGNVATDPIFFYPMSTKAIAVTIRAPLQLLANITLAGVVAKNRTAGANSPLVADLTAVFLVNSILVNTTRGNSVAHLFKNTAGTTWQLSQPFTPIAMPTTTLPSEVDTWANGDSVNVFSCINLFVTAWIPQLTAASFAGTANYANFYRVRLNVPAPAGTGILLGAVNLVESISVNAILPYGPANGVTGFVNHHWEVGGILAQSAQNCRIVGGVAGPGTAMGFMGRQHSIDGDFIAGGGLTFDGGLAVLGFVYIDVAETITGSGGSRVNFQNLFFGGHVVYGSAAANINARGFSRFFVSGTFTASWTFPLAISTGAQINGSSTGSSQSNGTPTVINGNIATTVANLDAAFGIAGFGGNAFKLGGAALNNVGQ